MVKKVKMSSQALNKTGIISFETTPKTGIMNAQNLPSIDEEVWRQFETPETHEATKRSF